MLKTIIDIRRHTLFKVLLGIAALVLTGSSLVIIFEQDANAQFQAMSDAVWWAVVTMTTVGYGDKVPVTTGGRLIGMAVMFFGMTLISLFTATVSSIFVARKIKEGRGLDDIKLKDHLVICGWNFNGEQVLRNLLRDRDKTGAVVLINQLPEETVSEIIDSFSGLKIKYVRGDFTKESVLARANIKSARAVIILPDVVSGLSANTDERTILATLSIKALNAKVKVYAHIVNRENLSHLRKAQADGILISDAYAGYLLSSHVLTPGIPQAVDLLFSDDASHRLFRYDLPESEVGKKYSRVRHKVEAALDAICLGSGREVEGVSIDNVLGHDYSYLDEFIKRKFEQAGRGLGEKNKISIKINPAPDTTLEANDFLILVGKTEGKS